MGFLDKAKQQAKQMADQAQTKLDEVQSQFGDSRRSPGAQGAGQSSAEYDAHGRAIPSDEEKPHGDPLTGSPGQAPPPPADKGPELRPEETDQDRPQGDPLRGDGPKPPKPPGTGSGMTSGDPLAG
jgi:hypothetical protein